MAARDAIRARYGDAYVPVQPAHVQEQGQERPGGARVHPADRHGRRARSSSASRPTRRKLYDLIWKRALASQMEAARFERTTVDVAQRRQGGRPARHRPGRHLRRLPQGLPRRPRRRGHRPLRGRRGRPPADDRQRRARRQARASRPSSTSRQPPPRYTEATLVKRMEELGIGRPSTYASIVSTIQEREYVRKEKNRLHPEDKGRLVTAFLANYFGRYVDYDFTADLEEDLDRVTTGEEDWKRLLARFWADFSAALAETEGLRISEVLDKINEVLEPHLFPKTPEDPEPRRCKVCGAGTLSLKTSRNGSAFIGCSNYPECRYTRPLAGDGDADAGLDGKLLGTGTPRRRALRGGRRRSPAGDAAQGSLRLLRAARRGHGRREAAARLDPEGHGPGGARARPGARAPGAAAARRPAPRGRRAGRGRHRPLRPVREVGQDLRQPPRPRGGLHHRHEPRRRAPRRRRPAAARAAPR